MRLLLLAIATAALAAGTWFIGWWSVPVIAALYGAANWKAGGRKWGVALAAFVAWGALLIADVSAGPYGALSGILKGVLNIPTAVLITVTLAFPALMAFCSATLGAETLRALRRR